MTLTPCLLHSSAQAAEEIASKLNEDDPDWTYKVAKKGNWFVLAVYDEEGGYLGEL
jgi:hypothetical protein